jgi:histone H3/H4
MARQVDFVKGSAVKEFIWSLGLRSSADAVEVLDQGFNAAIERVIIEAAKHAKRRRMKTIMSEHVVTALEKHVGKQDVDWQEILEQVLRETPADLGKITKGIRGQIEKSTRT